MKTALLCTGCGAPLPAAAALAAHVRCVYCGVVLTDGTATAEEAPTLTTEELAARRVGRLHDSQLALRAVRRHLRVEGGVDLLHRRVRLRRHGRSGA